MQENPTPFFVRFLEGEEFPVARTDVQAGWPNVTMKYPSDDDEGETS